MSKIFIRIGLITLSIGMLSSIVPFTKILAQEVTATESNISRREQVGEQIFTEDELEEYVVLQGGYLAYDEELVYNIQELERFFEEVFTQMNQDEPELNEEGLLEAGPEPSLLRELGTDTLYTWVAVGNQEMITIEAHASKSGDIVKLNKNYRSPKMFLPLSITEEELLSIYLSKGNVEELISLLGTAEIIRKFETSPATYYWTVLGESEVQTNDLIEIEVEVSPEGELLDVNYRAFE